MSQAASDSLLWIKNELDHTLVRARQALETYVERPEDSEALNQCLELLHQVQGTLRIVEVYGAAMLAEEMESVVRGLQSGEIERNDAAFEVLMRAMLQLPDYLERVIGGRRDMPLALLSLLNDLRGVRGQPLLSESALFAYNLAGRTASVVGHAADTTKAVDIKSLAGKLRPQFQTALLGWYKSGDETHLKVLAETAEKLEQAATTPAVFELWWIVGGVIEGLRESGIQAEVGLKQLLGQVDRQIKRLIDQGEADVAEDPAKELVNNLLYFVGRATSNGERIKAIKESFKLGELLPDAIEVEEAREGMSGPNVNLMRTVSGALKEDITRIKDTLDIFVRMAKTDATELAPLDELLKKVSDTLSVLNLEHLRGTLETERARLKSIVDRKGEPPDENALMDIASGIVSVETQLDEAMVGLISPETSERTGGIEVEQTEMREVQAAVIRESIINLARVKEAIVEFVNDPSHTDGLRPLPLHIREIQASLRFLHMDRVVALLESLRQYIRSKLLTNKDVPAQNELDRMADAIVSIEFYLETVQQGRGNPLSMLDNAEACVAALGFQVGQEYPEDGEEFGAGLASGVASVTGVETSVELPGESIVMSGPAEEEEESITLQAPADEPTQVMDKSMLLGVTPEPAPKPAGPSAAGPAVIQSDDVDPEIVEIFLEEAQEVMSALRENFPRWRSNPSDTEALTTVRRSFHTLKGSGRMVGARLIGEFAWSIENMLNRVIDQTIPASDEMFALVEQSIAAFPELIEQLEVGTPPKVDVQPLMDTAAAFSRGEPAPGSPGAAVPAPAAAPAPPPPRRTVSAEEPTMVSPAGLQMGGTDEPTVIAPRVEVLAPAGSGMDPVLYDIFNREADGHLAVLAEFTREAIAGKTEITEELIRALHTLHGSAAMAGASGIVALLEPLDRYVGELQAQKQSIPIDEVPLFGEAHDAARALLDALADTVPPPAPDAALLARLHALKAAPAAGEAAEMPAAEDIVMSGPAAVEESKEAAPARAVPQKDKPLKYVQLSDLKDFDPELAAIFFEEATELLESTDNTMHQWTQRKSDPAMVTQLQRNLHTIKGGARMAGLVPMGDLSHEMETVLTDVVDGRIAISTELFALLNRSVDRLHRMLEQSYANQPIVDGGDLVIELKRVHGHTVDEELEPEAPEDRYETVRAPAPPPPIIEYGEQQEVEVAAAAEPAAEPEEEAVAAEAALGGEGERRTGSRIQHELVRVRADLLESALNYAGEMGIYRSRLEQQITTINFNLTELDQTVVRLRDQLRKLEIETEAQILSQYVGTGEENPDFDPLELDQFSTLQQLSRALAESVGDLVSIQALLLNQAREAETLLLQQSRVTTELQDGLMRTRMVPFSRHAQRLRRVVRQTADESNKHVELKFMGAEGEMDRQVLERVLAPLEHMLRNSVVHGIELPAHRKQKGKPEAGTITISLHREGSEVVMEVMDDGAGLNLAAIRKKAEQLGLTRHDAKLSDRDVMSFILEAGFSTAEEVTQSAGRGVGMDVVASEIKQLGGSLRIDSQAGKGARFTVRLPFTLSITQALLVNMTEQLYAIPLPSIEGIARIPRAELERLMTGENPVYMYGGRPYYLQHLSVLLGIGAPEFPDELTTIPLLLVRSGDSSIAIITEGMQGSREVVVKSVGPQVSSIRGVSGATILGDGSILLILDVTALARGMALEEEAQTEVVEREAPKEDTRTVAMVVDDSITVRRVTQRLLERYNMKVITAKDGVDALATLQENIPDVMLLDIEMPRMDGYELAQHMRNDERFKNIPIIMITSRTGEKHRNRAMEIGVNKYLGKPYQEAELLENIQELVGSFSPQRTRW